MFAFLKGFLGWSDTRLVGCIADLGDRYRRGTIDLARVPVVVPHLRGSPPPRKDASARGAIGGLGMDTDAEGLVFGCFLAMAVQMRRAIDLCDITPTEVKVIGPASANDLWLQLKADVIGRDISVSAFPEMVSRGAQVLASGAAGDWRRANPWTVATDPDRHHGLAQWCADTSESFRRLAGAD